MAHTKTETKELRTDMVALKTEAAGHSSTLDKWIEPMKPMVTQLMVGQAQQEANATQLTAIQSRVETEVAGIELGLQQQQRQMTPRSLKRLLPLASSCRRRRPPRCCHRRACCGCSCRG